MKCEVLHLKDYYGFLGDNGRDPTVISYCPDVISEMGLGDKKRPCIIVCAGGGYAELSSREAEPIAMLFLSEGFNAFVINYSIKPHTYPVQICEVAAVTELIYKKADVWNCDVSKICIIGFSAGGHLAASYAVKYDCKEVREHFPESKAVNAQVLCYPVISAKSENGHLGSFHNLLGKNELTDEEIEYQSLECNVTDKTPPTFIWHTAADEIVPVNHSLCFAKALSEHKIPYEMHIYPYGNHGTATADSQAYKLVTPEINHIHSWINDVKKWLSLIGISV